MLVDSSQNSKCYKADEIANILGVKKFVIRTWEKQFNLNRSGMQYSDEDLIIFESIRDLLYGQRLSPTVAKEQLPGVLAQKAEQSRDILQSKVRGLVVPEPASTNIAVDPNSSEIDEVKIDVQEPVQEVVEFTETIEPAQEKNVPEQTNEQATKFQEEEIGTATLTSENASDDQVRPAFKQNEEFWNNLKTFKEQLLKIQEQLK
jgi:hypothetical protein